MKNITTILLAAAAMGAVSIGSASAMPFGNLSASLGESDVQDVRLVCGRYHRCYNTYGYRYASPYYAPGYYGGYPYGGYGYGYGYGRPFVGIGIGPFGLGF
jgi:hypothetical protein